MIRIFTGRDSAKKRNHVYNLIKGDATVITPEQSTLVIEKEILDAKKALGLIDVRITSFKRMINKLTSDVFDTSKEYITDVGKQMLFRYILKDITSELTLFSSVCDKEGFIEEIIYTIETLESEGIGPEVLREVIRDAGSKDTANKLSDIELIYSEYVKRVKDKYFHMSEGIELFNTYAHRFNVYSNENVWILGFKAFDKKALSMIEAISHHVKNLNIVISYEEDAIYEISRSTIDILKQKFDVEMIRFDTPKDTFSDFAHHLINGKEYEDIQAVSVLKTTDMYTEVEYVTLDIMDKIHSNPELLPEDFRIVVGSESYNKIIESTFESAKLPVFTDTRRHIINNKLVKTIISLMNIYVYGFRRDDVVSFLKGYIGEEGWRELDLFDHYVFENGIDRNLFLDDFRDEAVEELRRKYLDEIINYKDTFKGSHTPQYYSEKLVELLNKLDFLSSVKSRIENMSDERQEITSQVYNKVFEIIAQIYLVSNDDTVSFLKYLDYFKTAIKDVSVGVIPPTDGAIVIASISRSVHSSCKYLYVLGVSDSVIPKDYSDDDLLKEEEKVLINSKGYNVLSSNYNRALIDRLDENTMISFATDGVTFTSSSVDMNGESLMESRYISYLEENGVVPIDAITSSDYLNHLYFYDENIKYRYIVDSIRSGGNYTFVNANKAYVDDLASKVMKKPHEIFIDKKAKEFNTSVSRLELYNKCPFAYFIKYELKASELKEFSIDAMIRGTFLHEVLEIFFRDGYDSIFDVRSSVEKIVEDILSKEEYRVFSSSFRNRNELDRAKDALTFIARNLTNKMKMSSFKARRFEEKIDIEEAYYTLRGKIDRVDIFGNYFSIIDYKSSRREIKLDELYHGLSLQLPIYLDAYARLHSLTPAGMFYVEVKNHYSDEKSNREDLVKLNGLLIGDDYIARMYDHLLNENSKSNYIDVTFKKDGNFSSYSKVISPGQANLLIKKAKKNAIKSSKSMVSGDVSIRPASGIVDACKYCNYKSICRRDEMVIDHTIEPIDKKKFFELLEEEFELD